MELDQQMIAWIFIVLACLLWLTIGICLGIGWKAKTLRRAVMRNKGSKVLKDITITPTDDAIEVGISNAVLKRIKRGEKVDGLIEGNKNRMVLRICRNDLVVV